MSERDAIISEAAERGLKLEAIAALAGCSASTAFLTCRRLGLDPRAIRRAAQAERVRGLVADGKSASEIADELGLCLSRVSTLLRKLGLNAKRGRFGPAPQPLSERNRAIVEARHEGGRTYGQISRRFGISTRRAHEIVARHEARAQ